MKYIKLYAVATHTAVTLKLELINLETMSK